MDPNNDIELRSRLCNAEISAVLQKYGMQVAMKRVEQILPGGKTSVEVQFFFVPAPPLPEAN
jgi:hypothetical protein